MIEKIAQQIHADLATKMPGPRAANKAESTTIGWLAAIPGLVLLFVAGGAMILMVLNREEHVLLIALAAGFGFVGLVMFGLGMSLISRDAAPNVAAAGSFLIKVAKLVILRGSK